MTSTWLLGRTERNLAGPPAIGQCSGSGSHGPRDAHVRQPPQSRRSLQVALLSKITRYDVPENGEMVLRTGKCAQKVGHATPAHPVGARAAKPACSAVAQLSTLRCYGEAVQGNLSTGLLHKLHDQHCAPRPRSPLPPPWPPAACNGLT